MTAKSSGACWITTRPWWKAARPANLSIDAKVSARFTLTDGMRDRS
ncbi:hypothetical protein [Brevundimonas aurantiaca]|nr:hypothetical protein [Brevundimonas aurantiaca]